MSIRIETRRVHGGRFYDTGRFAVGARVAPSDDLMKLVNRNTESPVTEADVYIRSGVVCNNQVDLYSTRFTDRALKQIVKLWNAEPPKWHRQHDRYSAHGGLPIGRGLRAEIEPMKGVDGGLAVRGWWYYAKGDPEGDQIDRYVRLGIYEELSLSWWMDSYTCDVDGKPVYMADGEKSDYYPGQTLPDGRVVIGLMDQIVELDEFSLVSKGGQIGTTIEEARDGEPMFVGSAIAAARSRVDRKTPDAPRSWFAGWTQPPGA